MMRSASVKVALLLGMVLAVGFAPLAHADDTHSVWVPPGLVDKSGTDVGPLVVGQSIPYVSPVPVDVIDRATVGKYCAVRVGTFTWVDHRLTVTTSGEGGSWCSAPISLSSSWALPNLWCYVNGVAQQTTNVPIGGTSDGGATYVYTPRCGSDPAACVSWTKQESEWSGHWDGFTSCDPSPVAAAASLRIRVTCSDGTTAGADIVTGATVVAPSCTPPAVVVGVAALTVTGGTLGSVTTHADFPDVCRGGLCVPWVNSGGTWCHIRDAACGWWGGADAAIADGCAWGDTTQYLIPIPVQDCVAARPDFPVLDWGNSGGGGILDPAGSIVSAVASSASTIKKAIQDATSSVEGVVRSVGDGIKGAVQAVKDAVSAIPAAIARAVTPDPTIIGNLIGEGQGALGAPLSGWSSALSGMAGAWSTGSGSCQGPGIPVGVFGQTVELHPLDACSGMGAVLAPIVHLGTLVILLWEGSWACARNLASALGYTG